MKLPRGASHTAPTELLSWGALILLTSVSFACSSARVRADGPPAAPCLLEPAADAISDATASAPSALHAHAHHHHHHPAETAGGDSADAISAETAKPVVVAHQELTSYENRGNELVGIATPSLGAREHEVWRSRVAVGSSTPLHVHGSEEIFVFLRGRGRARIGDETVEFEAPATVIAPAGLPHQFFNTGDEPTEAIVIVRVGSQITDAEGAPLELPWRR